LLKCGLIWRRAWFVLALDNEPWPVFFCLPDNYNSGGDEIRMTYVTSRPGESTESLIKRFRRKVIGDRVMSEVRRRRYFVTKGEQARIDKRKGIRKARQHQRRLAQRQRGW